MAKTKKQNKSLDIQNKANTSYFSSFFSQIKFGESYTSLILGAVVVIIGLVLVLSLFKGKNNQIQPIQQTDSVKTMQVQETKTAEKTYIVKSGDDLWHISETLYGSGYSWIELANANNIDNPSIIYTGTKLTVPNIKPEVVKADQPTTQLTVQSENKITTTTYKIVSGDDLWDIAIRAYGDGYKWVEIAKANNLANPSLIHADNTLNIPR